MKEETPNNWHDRFVEHHTNYEKDEKKIIRKSLHKEIHIDPLHPLYPEDEENIPRWIQWKVFRDRCFFMFEDCWGIPNCKYYDSSVGYCLPRLCPRK